MNRPGGKGPQSPDIATQREEWLAAVKQRVANTVATALQPNIPDAILSTAMQTVMEQANGNIAMIEKNAENLRKRGQALPQVACHAGCDICCYIRVRCSIPEALYVVEYIRSNWSSEDIGALKQRVDANLAEFEGLTAQEKLNKMVPCPLLVDHECSIHKVRPVACRCHHSTDIDACRRAFINPDQVQIPHFLDVDTVIAPVISGIRSGIVNSKLKDPGLILVQALKVALQAPAAKAKWIAGDPLFNAAVDPDLKKLEEDELRRRQLRHRF